MLLELKLSIVFYQSFQEIPAKLEKVYNDQFGNLEIEQNVFFSRTSDRILII